MFRQNAEIDSCSTNFDFSQVYVSIFWRMDIVLEKRPAEVAKDVFRGLKLIWFSKRPGFLVVPLTLLFFVFIIVFGGTKLILYVYLEVKNMRFFSYI
jgi:hypothetical protein